MTQATKQTTRVAAGCCPDLAALIDPEVFRALGDPNRVALLAHLGRRGRPTTVTEAAECCPVDLSVVSRHLAVLRRAGVVEWAKAGREVRYTLSPGLLAARLRSLADALEACCPAGPAAGAGPTRHSPSATPAPHPPAQPTEE